MQQLVLETQRVTKNAIQALRAKLLLSDIPIVQIADELGVNRNTIVRQLHRDSIPLDMFIAYALAIHIDPSELLHQAIEGKLILNCKQENDHD